MHRFLSYVIGKAIINLKRLINIKYGFTMQTIFISFIYFKDNKYCDKKQK